MWTITLNFLKKNWKFVLILLLIVALGIAIEYSVNMKHKYQREVNNVDALTSELELSRTKQGESVATIKELQYTVDEFKRRQVEDAALIKELKVRANEVREVVKTVTETKIVYRDTMVLINPKAIEWAHSTKWWDVHQTIDLAGDKPVTNLKLAVRDSLSHILYKVPKCKFLGIHWGTSHYEVKVVNHNPDVTIKYAQWINISKKERKRKRE